MNTNNKLKNLRDLMKDKSIDAYIVATADPHQSEYIADHYKSRIWLSGFTGSAGTLVVTLDEAILWTDGRYFTQAEKELKGSDIDLYKMGIPGYPTYQEWLGKNLGDGDRLGFDGRLMSVRDIESLRAEFASKDIKFESNYDLIDKIWIDRPKEPKTKVFIHSKKYTGYSSGEKIEKLRLIMEEKNADYNLISSLDDIAWLYNIRASDVPNNPVSLSYALVSQDQAYLFIDSEKLPVGVKENLEDNKITIRGYEEIIDFLSKIGEDKSIILDKSKVNYWLYSHINEDIKIIDEINITSNLKAVKNKVEMKNQRKAYIKDGLAFTKLLYWLDTSIGKKDISEFDVSRKLEEFRKENDLYIEPSFISIAAYGPNAAMMHYRPSEEKSDKLEEKGLFLLDAGGQYIDGTTDTTRTVALGKISEEERKDFTLTLKSHINLIGSKFLEGTTGYKLDAIARYPMWQEGLDYKCGTGHGVGYFLNVHEGPHRIANVFNDVPLDKGMVVTIEPGVYKAGKHGIRIENVGLVRDDMKTDSGQFKSFEVLSFVPIDTSCINKELLSKKEINWINSYHKKVYENLSPHLEGDIKAWLKEKTKEI